MVRIISIVVPWTILCGIGLVCSLKCHKARTNIRDTKTKIRMRKKKISWCKSMIPCIIGVAASWDPNCHGSAASQRAIVRNRHSNERRIIGISHLFQLCSLTFKRKGDLSWRRRWFFQRKTRTFFHELPWQNASCLVTHTLEVPSTKATIRVFWGATLSFLFLWLERCFSSPGCLLPAHGFSRQFKRLTYLGISGSMLICNSPKHFVACYALPRLWVPRYPPQAFPLLTLAINVKAMPS